MKTKSGSFYSYMLQVADHDIKMISAYSLKVKLTIKLNEMHIKNDRKVAFPDAISDEDTQAESP